MLKGGKEYSCLKKKYILDLLKETGTIGAKPSNSPMIPNIKLGLEDRELVEDLERYRCLVGKLNYLTRTKLNIAFPIDVVSPFINSSKTFH